MPSRRCASCLTTSRRSWSETGTDRGELERAFDLPVIGWRSCTPHSGSSRGIASGGGAAQAGLIDRGRLGLQKKGEADAFVSAGSTGAVMAASLLILRPLPGVDRPPVATTLPTAADPIVLVDAGANVDSKPHHLVQFARLGAIYAHDVLRRSNPRVGLLNIGEEPEKGDELAVEAHGLLRKQPGLNFIGNVEGRDIITGTCDVLVADGFVGNVLLKFYESIAAFFMGILKREQEKSGARMDLSEIFAALDYTEYGGAPLLGFRDLDHMPRRSPPRAIQNDPAAIGPWRPTWSGMSRELTVPPMNGGGPVSPGGPIMEVHEEADAAG